MDQILTVVRTFDGVLVWEPGPGGDAPEIAWGDAFCYYAPDGTVPRNTQPYATIVTKDYPDDTGSNLDPAGRYRVNVHVGRTAHRELTGQDPQHPTTVDFATPDVLLPHPVYGPLGWVAVVNPDTMTDTVIDLLRRAHADARDRHERRAAR